MPVDLGVGEVEELHFVADGVPAFQRHLGEGVRREAGGTLPSLQYQRLNGGGGGRLGSVEVINGQ